MLWLIFTWWKIILLGVPWELLEEFFLGTPTEPEFLDSDLDTILITLDHTLWYWAQI